jgi:hypothetical protein
VLAGVTLMSRSAANTPVGDTRVVAEVTIVVGVIIVAAQ